MAVAIEALWIVNQNLISKENKTYTLKKSISLNELKIDNIGTKFNKEDYIELKTGEIFDGNKKNINITWPNLGIFSINSTADKSTQPMVRNLMVNSKNRIAGGGIIRSNQRNFKVDRCISVGNIGIRAGGIVGLYACENGGNCTITNCYSKGAIGERAGGIVGLYTCFDGGSCTITNCYSKGTIGREAGGIVGPRVCNNGGNCTIINCYSKGAIRLGAGGIVGALACGSYYSEKKGGNCIITNCYSTGNIEDYASGIIGENACTGGEEGTGKGGNCIISNCYASGSLSNNAAGIVISLGGGVFGM